MNQTTPVTFNKPTKTPKTVLTLGMARSGTSMLAATLDALGVNMGGNGIDGHYERIEFKWDFTKDGNWGNTLGEIERLNKEYKMWGTKTRLSGIRKMVTSVTDPCLIIMFRDLASILERHISYPDHRTIPQIMDWMRMQLGILWEWALSDFPVMLVSCEKLRYDSLKTINSISDFLMLDDDPLKRNEALKRISKSGGYIRQDVD